MANKPIPVTEAEVMKQQYLDYMTKLGVDMKQQTHSVSFNSKILQAWMQQVDTVTDEFRIFLGVYPPASPNAGRISTIIWPYKNGQPATRGGTALGDDGWEDPFNDGEGRP